MYKNNIPRHCLLDISESLNLIVLKKYFFSCLSVPENQQGAEFHSTVPSISCHIPKAVVSCSTGRDLLRDSVLMFRNSRSNASFYFSFLLSEPSPFYFQLCILSCILYAVGLCMQGITTVNNTLRSAVKITLVSKFVVLRHCITAVGLRRLKSSSSSYICHGVGPLVDPFRSHVSRSIFKGLP